MIRAHDVLVSAALAVGVSVSQLVAAPEKGNKITANLALEKEKLNKARRIAAESANAAWGLEPPFAAL
jgi:hypothetical protein